MGVVKLVRRDPVVARGRVAAQVHKELRERIHILDGAVREEGHRVVLHGVVELGRAVKRIGRGGVGPRGAVGWAGAQLHVLLVILPGHARRIQLGGQVNDVVIERISIGCSGIRVRVDSEIRPRFRPYIIGLGRMLSFAGVEIFGGV